MTRRKLYKLLGSGGAPMHGGHGKWSLPRGGKPGEWMPPVEGPVEACRNGYHLCEREDVVGWLTGNGVDVYEAEGRGDRVDDANKIAFRQARLLRRVGHLDARGLRLLAADYAERVLPIFERARPGDDRPRKAIQAARDYADGEISAAAGDAAWAAARDAAGAAAWDAAWDAARAAAWAAARDAARAAARDAAGDAAGAAAWAAERRWQTRRLWRYLEAPR